MNYSGITQQQREIIDYAAHIGAQAGIAAYKEEQRYEQQEKQNRKLHNTRLLLSKYRMLKTHIENATFKKSQLTSASAIEWINEMYDPQNKADQIVESIMNSAVKTKIMFEHINKMLDIYTMICQKGSTPKLMRRLEVLNGRYISENQVSFEAISEKWNVDVRTIQNDMKEAIEDFSLLLFGIDWINRIEKTT